MQMRRCISAASAAVALVALTGIGATASAEPQGIVPAHAAGTAYPQAWCSYPKSPPCVVSVTQDGTPVLPSDTTWVATISSSDATTDGNSEIQWFMDDQNAGVHDNGSVYASMGASQTSHLWSMTVRVDTDPRSISGYMDQMQTSVTDNGDGTWDVTTTGYPVTTGVNDECSATAPWSCPYRAGADVTLFQAQSDNFQYSSIPAAQQNDYSGLQQWTNVEESSLPPEISGDPLQITEPLTNSHELHTGAVFEGFFHAILPNAFLVDMGIDDPSTIDPGSIAASVGSGSVSVTPGAGSTEIDITGITFSHRVLKIKRGTITPTRPRIRTARRSATRVVLRYGKARPRGSRIVRYAARCLVHGRPIRTASGPGTRLTVRHLSSGVGYACQVRAKAKAGYGGWSARHTVRG